MASSAFFSSSFSATANNILNKFDNAPIYNTSTGAWSFKNSSGTEVLSSTGAGAWTFGASGAGAHTAQASATGVGTVLIVNNLTDATNAASIRFRDNGSTMGSVGSSTSYPLRVTSNTDTEVFNVAAGLSGTLSISAGVVSGTSDMRLKDLTENQELDGLSAVNSLKIRRYTWKPETKFDTKTHLGFFAQEVGAVIPEALGDEDALGRLGMWDRPIIAAAVKAIQELHTLLQAEKARNEALDTKVSALEARLAALENK